MAQRPCGPAERGQNDARIDPARHRGEFVPGPSHRPGESLASDPPRAADRPLQPDPHPGVFPQGLPPGPRPSALAPGNHVRPWRHGPALRRHRPARAMAAPPAAQAVAHAPADPAGRRRDHRLRRRHRLHRPAHHQQHHAAAAGLFRLRHVHPDPPGLRGALLRSGDAGLRGGDGPRPGRPATAPVEPGQRPHRVRPRPAAVADPLARPRAQPAPATQAGVAAAGAGGEESPVGVPGRSRPPDRPVQSSRVRPVGAHGARAHRSPTAAAEPADGRPGSLQVHQRPLWAPLRRRGHPPCRQPAARQYP